MVRIQWSGERPSDYVFWVNIIKLKVILDFVYFLIIILALPKKK